MFELLSTVETPIGETNFSGSKWKGSENSDMKTDE
jgi:hypothetical protein